MYNYNQIFLYGLGFYNFKTVDTSVSMQISKAFGSKFTDLYVYGHLPFLPLMPCSRLSRGTVLKDQYASVCADISRTSLFLIVPEIRVTELHVVLRTKIMRGCLLGFFTVTPSVTFYLKIIYSVMPFLLRIWAECFLALCRLFAWLCFCSYFFFFFTA